MNSVMRTPRSEAGFALIEVVVSAMVLAIVALAVLSGIDAANGASAREKARAVAANLAERDQERLRAMPVALLKDPPAMPPTEVDGVVYTIKSETRWITDDLGGEPSCGSATNQVEYMQIRTTVTSKYVNGKKLKPITVDSLVAPTQEWVEDHGTLAVKVVDRTNVKGVAGIPVAAVSTSFTPPTAVTDATGCAVFKSVPIGSYTLRLNTAGYMNRDGEQLSEENQTVVAKTISIATMVYDRATSARATVTTHVPRQVWSTSNTKASKARHVSLVNGASVGLHRTFAPTSPPQPIVDATALFPFAENDYSVFTGMCKYASPDTYTANRNYYTQTNTLAALKADPAQSQPQPVTLRQPPLNVRVLRNQSGSNGWADGTVVVYAQLQKPAGSSDSCDEPIFTLTTKPWPVSGWGSAPRTSAGTGTNNHNHWVSQVGTDFDPGLPFGVYEFCLRDTAANRGVKWTGGTMNGLYDNTAPDGNTGTGLDISMSSGWSSTTTCASF
jgi:Tfp pilus assembly protein PilV